MPGGGRTGLNLVVDYRGEQALESMRACEARLKAHQTCERCRKAPSVVGNRTRVLCGACRTLERRGSVAPAAPRRSPAPRRASRVAPTTLAPAVAASPARRQEEIVGYVVVWGDVVRRDVGDRNHCGLSWAYDEAFAPYAFRSWLAGRPEVLARINHRDLIGKTSDGSLQLREDDYGLAFTLTPYASDAGERAVLCARAGSVCGMSPTWTKADADFAWSSPAMRVREITRTKLVEISIVIGAERPSFRMGWAAIATPAIAQRMKDLAASAWRG